MLLGYELAKELCESGWPQDYAGEIVFPHEPYDGTVSGYFSPALSAIIAGCPEEYENRWFCLCVTASGWAAGYFNRGADVIHERRHAFGSTPEEAVARLWISLPRLVTP
jgi:hypothetical protein